MHVSAKLAANGCPESATVEKRQRDEAEDSYESDSQTQTRRLGR